jgi:DNA-binding NtrC family response regulator
MRKRGRFELAHNGTLFLDEIGEINQNVQIKILRVLQERTFERVGGEETIEVDVRIIAATNRDLKSEIEKGNFREDLYYRLNVVNIALPLLSERREDIPLLVSSFIKELSRENDKNVNGIDSKATKALYAYSWPGNVRELRNCIESSIVMCKTNIISLDDLPPYIQSNSDKDFIRLSFGTSLSEVEKAIIIFNLSKNNGNKSKTAEMLGIGRKTLHRKIKEYNIDI